MIIEKIVIKNFRSIKHATLSCEELTVIIGRNGVGKSAFLKALEFFYDIAAPISEEDYCYRNINDPIEISVTYANLNENEEEEFRSYIKDDNLTILKRITYENSKHIQKYYAESLQIPRFAEIRSIQGRRDRINAWNELIDNKELPGIDQRARSADDVEIYMNEYEANYPDLKEYVPSEEQFFGPRNIGGGKLDNHTRFVYVPAVTEAADMVSNKKGAFQQILDLIILRKINDREDIKEFKIEYEKKVEQLYCKESIEDLSSIGKMLSKTLSDFAPGSELNLEWEEIKVPEIPYPSVKGILLEDNFEGDISRKGHGLQRALIITLLQHLALIGTEEIEQESMSSIVNNGPDIILAIEEPELYLHPSRCHYLAELFRKLVDHGKEDDYNEEIEGARNQILLTSHSPYFIELKHFDNIRLIRKQLNESMNLESKPEMYSLEQASKILAELNNDNPDKYTRDSFRVRALPVINSIVNEGFFADAVVVVEGLSDVGIIWKLQEILGMNWHRRGIVVVPAGGVNNIDRPVIVFRGLNIPNYFIFDADVKCTEDSRKKVSERNKRYMRLAGVMEEEFPKTQVHNNWAVFANDIETLIEDALGSEEYKKIIENIMEECGYFNKKKDVCKNIEGASTLIETIYEKEKKAVPILEQIIEKISKLGR